VEVTSKYQALKVGWQIHSLQYLVEATSGRPLPHRLLEAQKTRGGYISCGQVKYVSEISYLILPKYSRIKGFFLNKLKKISNTRRNI